MTCTDLAVRGSIAETLDELFEPVRAETLASIFEDYRRDRAMVDAIADLFEDSGKVGVLEHFLVGNTHRHDRGGVSVERLFGREQAVKALDASYWSRALGVTDVYEAMPQARRDEWRRQVDELKTPAFDPDTVVATLQGLMAERHRFFAERVDGIFQALSRRHVTNSPMGFGKRMILDNVVSWGYADFSQCGHIADLRVVIAKFMGREPPAAFSATAKIINWCHRAENRGEWFAVDGGALRVRVYSKTVHLEVHPEMAWRLNAVLASIHPSAIPSKHRTRPKRKPSHDVVLMSRPLPGPVVDILASGTVKGIAGNRVRIEIPYSTRSDPAYREAAEVLESIGGVSNGVAFFDFDYDATTVIMEVIATGVIPDKRAHQYYPTTRPLAERMVGLANIEPGHAVLEPSAGQGAIAELLPKDDLVLVEVSDRFCAVLSAKGFGHIEQADFLKWAEETGLRFDRVVMNPPYSHQRWRAHLESAAALVKPGGRIVALLPSSAADKDVLPGWSCTWSESIPFPGTSIEVVILCADCP